MRAYLIDPVARTVTDVECNGVLHGPTGIYALLQCTTIDVVHLSSGLTADSMYVDDEALIKDDAEQRNQRGWFAYRDYPQALNGRGLVLGTDKQGDSISPVTPIETIRENIVFLTPTPVGLVPFNSKPN